MISQCKLMNSSCCLIKGVVTSEIAFGLPIITTMGFRQGETGGHIKDFSLGGDKEVGDIL